MRRGSVVIVMLLTGCSLLNPEFDSLGQAEGESGEASATDEASGTNETGNEQGSGDGDGDGNTTTPGDGDGDGTAGMTRGGDGDGDGPTGEENAETDETAGDGDGDAPVDDCDPGEVMEPYSSLESTFVFHIDASGFPAFLGAPVDCYRITVCPAGQPDCGFSPNFMALMFSGENIVYVNPDGPNLSTPLQLVIGPGDGDNNCPALIIEPLQTLEIGVELGMSDDFVDVLLPCSEEEVTKLFIADDGSTFWNSELTEPAALW